MRNSADSVSSSDEGQSVGAGGSKLIEMLKEVCLLMWWNGVLNFCVFRAPMCMNCSPS